MIDWYRKLISGSYLKQNNSDLVFQTHTIFLKWVGHMMVTWWWLDWIFQGGYLPSLTINYAGISKDMGKRLPQLYFIITSKKNFIYLHSAALLQFLHVIWSMPTNFPLFKKLLNKLFTNLTIPRSMINKYTLQVSRTLKTGKAFK